MPRYLIIRDVSGWDDAELQACMLRAKLCVPRYQGLTWHLSYYDVGSGLAMCHVEAPNEDMLWDHARSSGLPITSVQQVTQLNPADFEPAEEEVAAETRSDVVSSRGR